MYKPYQQRKDIGADSKHQLNYSGKGDYKVAAESRRFGGVAKVIRRSPRGPSMKADAGTYREVFVGASPT